MNDTNSANESQLEFFGRGKQPNRAVTQRVPGRIFMWLRYEQAVLIGIASLIGLTIVFACGVERGKQIARLERSLLISPRAGVNPSDGSTSATEEEQMQTTVPEVTEEGNERRAPVNAVKPKEPSKFAGESGNYAIQVVTYRKVRLAKEELERLHVSGERAFLKIGGGFTVLYVGPFPTKENAREKLSKLRSRYQDCFVKTL